MCDTYNVRQHLKSLVKCLKEPGTVNQDWAEKCLEKTRDIGMIISFEVARQDKQQEADRQRRIATAKRRTQEFQQKKEKEAIQKQLEEDEAVLLQASKDQDSWNELSQDEEEFHKAKKFWTNDWKAEEDLEEIVKRYREKAEREKKKKENYRTINEVKTEAEHYRYHYSKHLALEKKEKQTTEVFRNNNGTTDQAKTPPKREENEWKMVTYSDSDSSDEPAPPASYRNFFWKSEKDEGPKRKRK